MHFYPSVTDVLRPWSGIDKIDPQTLRRPAARGTLVHEIALNSLLGILTIEIDPELEGYLASFDFFVRSQVKEVLEVERRMVDTVFGFHGQLDLLCRLNEGDKVALIDLKTPKAASKVWSGQIAAYDYLRRGEAIQADRLGSLRLDQLGGPPKMSWYEYRQADFDAFLNALMAFKYFS